MTTRLISTLFITVLFSSAQIQAKSLSLKILKGEISTAISTRWKKIKSKEYPGGEAIVYFIPTKTDAGQNSANAVLVAEQNLENVSAKQFGDSKLSGLSDKHTFIVNDVY